jgi:hypothetical protein
VFPSNDRVHVVRTWNDDPHVVVRGKLKEGLAEIARANAVTIYKNGGSLHTFPVSALFDVNRFGSREGGLGTWVFWGHVDSFQDEEGLVTLKARDGQEATIDFRTGTIVSGVCSERGKCGNSMPDGPTWLAALVAGGVVVMGCSAIFGVLFFVLLRRQGPPMSD